MSGATHLQLGVRREAPDDALAQLGNVAPQVCHKVGVALRGVGLARRRRRQRFRARRARRARRAARCRPHAVGAQRHRVPALRNSIHFSFEAPHPPLGLLVLAGRKRGARRLRPLRRHSVVVCGPCATRGYARAWSDPRLLPATPLLPILENLMDIVLLDCCLGCLGLSVADFRGATSGFWTCKALI